MTINVIYDLRHNDDYERLPKEFERQGITDFKFWYAMVYPDSVVRSINASHKMIVKWAKEKKMKEVVIAEQDLWFPAEDGWQHFLNNKPSKFDIYAAATYVQDLKDKNILCGFHLYIVKEHFYDTFLSVKDGGHIDTEIDNLKGDYKVCRPFAALQRPGFSANHTNALVNYNSILKEEDVYGKFR